MTSRRAPFAKRRKAVGFSQERLAERLGVDRSTIVRWEAGETEPRPWMRPRLARALQVSVGELDGLLGDVARQRSRPDCFLVESHQFIPAYVGAERAADLASGFVRLPDGWLDCHRTAIYTDRGRCRLYVFGCGVVVFHISELMEFFERCRSCCLAVEQLQDSLDDDKRAASRVAWWPSQFRVCAVALRLGTAVLGR